MDEYLLKITEVAVLVGVTPKTIENWYLYKKECPDAEITKLLPPIVRKDDNKLVRYWRREDVYKLIEFKSNVTVGRNGTMGKVTRKYVKDSNHYYKDKGGE